MQILNGQYTTCLLSPPPSFKSIRSEWSVGTPGGGGVDKIYGCFESFSLLTAGAVIKPTLISYHLI